MEALQEMAIFIALCIVIRRKYWKVLISTFCPLYLIVIFQTKFTGYSAALVVPFLIPNRVCKDLLIKLLKDADGGGEGGRELFYIVRDEVFSLEFGF